MIMEFAKCVKLFINYKKNGGFLYGFAGKQTILKQLRIMLLNKKPLPLEVR
jgi:hypothetical protein